MNRRSDDEILIRQFLLGQLSEQEHAQIAWRRSADPEYEELLDAVEEELVDDYACGRLKSHDRHRFESHYLISDERRQKLHEARILSQAITKRNRRVWPGWIAAAAGVAIAFLASAVSWQRLARLELSVAFHEGVSRDSGARQVLRLSPGVLLVAVNLNPNSAQAANSAVLRALGSEDDLWRQRVSAMSDGGVHLDLPAAFLQDGHYVLHLEHNGQVTATFSFQVTRK